LSRLNWPKKLGNLGPTTMAKAGRTTTKKKMMRPSLQVDLVLVDWTNKQTNKTRMEMESQTKLDRMLRATERKMQINQVRRRELSKKK